jgi:hypothetical protein
MVVGFGLILPWEMLSEELENDSAILPNTSQTTKLSRLADELFEYMIKEDSDLTMYTMYCSEKSFFDSNHIASTDGLTAAEWESAALLYNRRTPLSTEEEALFRAHDKVIIHAALHGLRYVLVYGTYKSHFGVHPIAKLPPMPELDGLSNRLIYLTSCVSTVP